MFCLVLLSGYVDPAIFYADVIFVGVVVVCVIPCLMS